MQTEMCLFDFFNHLRQAYIYSPIARFMGPTRGPPASCQPRMGPMLGPWTLLSGLLLLIASVLWFDAPSVVVELDGLDLNDRLIWDQNVATQFFV